MPVVRPTPMSVSCHAVVTGIKVGFMPCGDNEHRGRFFLSCPTPCASHVVEAGANKKSTSCDVLSL